MKKALAERVLKAEMDHHLADEQSGSPRNGYGRKRVLTATGAVELSIRRDLAATCDPQLIGMYHGRFPGFDEKIISMCARGMLTREITGHLRDLHGMEVSAYLILAVTDAGLEGLAGSHPVSLPFRAR